MTGRVENIEPYIVGADLVVIPLRGGAGVKVKLLEAPVAEKLILTTDYSISGTKITANEEVLLANSATTFADKAIKALQRPEEYEAVQRSGHRYAQQHHNWISIIDDLEKRMAENIS